MRKVYQKPTPKFYFTPEGLEKIKQEYQELLASRPDAVEHLKKSRELGDLSENGYYKASKAKLVSIDARLRRFSSFIKYAQLILPTNHSTRVQLGSFVTVAQGAVKAKYQIVGAFEANPEEGKISDVSPLGKVLMGKKAEETAEVITPTTKIIYTIKAIS